MTTILCVEDEAPLRGAIVEELEDNNYDVLQATDGREGLEMMLKHEPDLVLCDIIMPHMNGYDLVKTLREKHPRFADTPFIFLSALADRRDILEGMDRGADDYLTKPVDFGLLLGKIKTRLRQVERMQARQTVEAGPQAPSHKGALEHDDAEEIFSHARLSKAQVQVLSLLGEGKTNEEIAKVLLRSTHTIKVHVSAILRQLNLKSRTQVALLASRLPKQVFRKNNA